MMAITEPAFHDHHMNLVIELFLRWTVDGLMIAGVCAMVATVHVLEIKVCI